MTRTKPKILVIDVETTPLILAGFGMREQNFGINQILASTRIMCFAYKWHGESKIKFHSEWDDGQEEQAKILHKLFDEAEIILGYNSRRFDERHVNREIMLTAKLPSPSQYEHIDLFTQWKRIIATPSNKLEFVTQVTGYESKLTKMQNAGMSLWLDCMGEGRLEHPVVTEEEQAAARKIMRAYNVQDVRITDALYVFLRDQGWLKNVPNLAAYSDKELACKTCGNDDEDRIYKKASKAMQSGIWRYNYFCAACKSHFTTGVDKAANAKKRHLKAVG